MSTQTADVGPPRSEGQTRRLALGSRAGLLGRCRGFTRSALRDWGWWPSVPDGPVGSAGRAPQVEDALLVVSELVTNALLHGGDPVELRLHGEGPLLRIEVQDRNPGLPRPRAPHDGTRPGGHGLHIIARLARDWGCVPVAEGGKTVWAELAAFR